MGKMIKIMGATYTPPSQDGNNTGGGTGGNNTGGGNNQPTVVTLTVKLSPANIALQRNANTGETNAMYASAYSSTRIAAVDVSAYSGRRVAISKTPGQQNGVIFVGDTAALGLNDVENIESWNQANFPDKISSYKSINFTAYQLSGYNDGETNFEAVVPAGSKWLLFNHGTANTTPVSVEVV